MVVSDTHTIYATQNTAIMQNDDCGKFILSISGASYTMDRYAYTAFRKRIKSINLAEMICSEGTDIVIVELTQTANFLILDIRQVIELKELLAGTSAMLELNACIHKQICRKALHS